MAHPLEKREYVETLRRKGGSIVSIAQKVHVPKATVSYWCRDIVLSKTQLQRLRQQSRRAGMASFQTINEARRNRRMQEVSREMVQGSVDVGRVSKRDLFMIGVGLYWGEGYKSGNDEFGFSNSDPRMIRVYIRWLETVFSIKREQLILRVSINASHALREKKVLQYWQHITSAPSSQFTKTSFIKTSQKKLYSNHEQHYGTLRIKVRKQRKLQYRVKGAIERVASQCS